MKSILKQSKTCFFLCDIQEKFRIIHGYPQVINTAKKLVKASSILNVPLIVTEHYPKALGNTVSELDISNRSLLAEKTLFSMMIPKVEQHLEQLQPETVVLFGIESHVCVLQTALDLLCKGYGVYIVLDAISSINKCEAKMAVRRLSDAGCTLTTSETILFELLKDASHPQFKQISSLIKETKHETKEALETLLSHL